MKLVVGLGNPGAKYKSNRHNIGFMAIDSYAMHKSMSWRFSQDWVGYYSKGEGVVLAKSATYMNKSGVTVASIRDFYKVADKDILVVHDDLDLAFGKIRLAFGGSGAGHHGVNSVIESLATLDFGRLRVGIGHPAAGKVEDYVLVDFSEEEKKKLAEIITKSRDAIESYVADGIEATMNKFN